MIEFKDCEGQSVLPGDTIIILAHHNYIFNNQTAVVSWDSNWGQFNYSCVDKKLSGRYDFCGVGSFKKITIKNG